MSDWILLEERLPERWQLIFYTVDYCMRTAFGRYGDHSNPMPSAPFTVKWKDVVAWMPLPKAREEKS